MFFQSMYELDLTSPQTPWVRSQSSWRRSCSSFLWLDIVNDTFTILFCGMSAPCGRFKCFCPTITKDPKVKVVYLSIPSALNVELYASFLEFWIFSLLCTRLFQILWSSFFEMALVTYMSFSVQNFKQRSKKLKRWEKANLLTSSHLKVIFPRRIAPQLSMRCVMFLPMKFWIRDMKFDWEIWVLSKEK